MSNNPTRRPRGIHDRIIDALQGQERNFIQSLKPISGDSIASIGGLGGGGTSGGNAQASKGEFLPIAGGTMLGPIAFNPVQINTHKDGSLRGHLDISKDTGKFSSKLIINAAPSGWNLSYIDGAYWDGQLVKIDVLSGFTLIIQPDGNIALPKNQPMSFLGPIVVELEFDSTLGPNGNAGGWELVNIPFQLNGCDVATKCYVDRQFQIAGFNQNGVTEYITENAWVCLTCFFDAPIIEEEIISEVGVANTIFVTPPLSGSEYISESVQISVI